MTRIANVFLRIVLPLMLIIASSSIAQNVDIVERSTHQREAMKKQAKAANLKRQADLKRDTDRLLELATELKTQVDQTNENILSVSVIRKAEEIEKLARSVKGKMKESVGPERDEPSGR